MLGLRSLPMPVVCAVNGVAAGAGANLALACDIVIAARSASFIEAFCKLGLIPDTGGTYFLPRLVGTARAMGLALLGDKLTAEQAAAWGLIWQCVDDAELPALVGQACRAFRAGADARARAHQAGAPRERRRTRSTRSSTSSAISCASSAVRDDYREGVAAFMAKRAAEVHRPLTRPRCPPRCPPNAIVAVIGAGAMGAGIAQVAALAGHRVQLHDARFGAADAAKNGIAEALAKQAAKGRLAPADADRPLSIASRPW